MDCISLRNFVKGIVFKKNIVFELEKLRNKNEKHERYETSIGNMYIIF